MKVKTKCHMPAYDRTEKHSLVDVKKQSDLSFFFFFSWQKAQSQPPSVFISRRNNFPHILILKSMCFGHWRLWTPQRNRNVSLSQGF